MRILGVYSFNRGKEFIEKNFPKELEEVKKVIKAIDSENHITKESKEKTMKGKMLYSPVSLNKAFKKQFFPLGWINHK